MSKHKQRSVKSYVLVFVLLLFRCVSLFRFLPHVHSSLILRGVDVVAREVLPKKSSRRCQSPPLQHKPVPLTAQPSAELSWLVRVLRKKTSSAKGFPLFKLLLSFCQLNPWCCIYLVFAICSCHLHDWSNHC